MQAAIVLTGVKMPVGTIDTRQVVASTTATAGEAYSLALPASAPVLSAAKLDGGWVNLELTTFGSRGTTATTQSFKLSSVKDARDDTVTPMLVPNSSRAVAWPAVVDLPNHPADRIPVSCDLKVTGNKANLGRIAQLSTWNDDVAYLTYGQSADSNIDISVGYDADGNGASGSIHVGNSTATTVHPDRFKQMRDNFILSQFSGIQEELQPAPNPVTEYCDNAIGYEVRASQWDGGTPVLGAKVPSYGNLEGKCPTHRTDTSTPYGHDSGMTRASSQAVTLGGALTLFGSALTMQSGYSTDMQVTWDTGTADANHWFCGTVNPPTVSSLVWNGINT